MMSDKEEIQDEQPDSTKNAAGEQSEEAVITGDSPESGQEDAGAAQDAIVIEQLQAEVEQMRDQHLRAMAEVENVRRRADTDVANSRKFAVESFARELLAVRDSLELASTVEIEAVQDEVVAKMEEGLQLTLKQMDHVFEKFDIGEVDAEPGMRPDPEIHQAMSLVDSEEVGSGEIVSVMQKGYRLHDRLLRPAMVLVAK